MVFSLKAPMAFPWTSMARKHKIVVRASCLQWQVITFTVTATGANAHHIRGSHKLLAHVRLADLVKDCSGEF